jgi:hypothetical protein
MISMIIHLYGLGRTTQNKCDRVNPKLQMQNKHSSYLQLLECNNYYYEYNTHT